MTTLLDEADRGNARGEEEEEKGKRERAR